MDPDSQEPGVDFDETEENLVRDLYLEVDGEYWCYKLDAFVVYTGFYRFDHEHGGLYLLFNYYRATSEERFTGEEYGIWLPESEVDL